MLCAHVEKPDDTERYWYYKCKLKKQKPIDEYGHIDPLVRKMEVKVMVKIVFDIESCLECPSCEEQEAVFGHAFLRHSLINVCPECEGGPGYGPYIPEILEQLNGRCVEDEDGNVSGVPDWCPRLASARDVADESFEEEE